MCGFRPVAESVALLARLGVAALDADVETLRAHPDADGIRAVVTRLLRLPPDEAARLRDRLTSQGEAQAAGL